MLSGYDEDKPIEFEKALELISNNHPSMKRFYLNRIIINPTQQNFGVGRESEMLTVSHIYDTDLIRLAAAFKKNKTIETVIIDGTDSTRDLRWTECGANAIGESLKDHPTISLLAIETQTYQLEETQIIGFLRCLGGKSNITRLSMDFYQDSCELLNELGKLLLEKNCLKSIHISGSFFNKPKRISTSLINFFNGIGTQKKLTSLSLEHLNLSGQNWQEIAATMQEISFLTVFKLVSCGISAKDIQYVLSLTRKNTELTTLNLGYNSLGEDGIQIVAQNIPLLKKLKKLDLSKTNLNVKALKSLVSTLTEEKIVLSNLRLSSNPMDSSFIDELNRLIDGNTGLKSLDLSFCNLTGEHLEIMRPILQDPQRCFLETLAFVSNFKMTIKIREIVSDIMYLNETICLHHGWVFPEHQVLQNMNEMKLHQKTWGTFIETVLSLGIGCYSVFGTSPSHLAQLDDSILFMILSYLVPSITTYAKKNGVACSKLIFKSLATRKKAIDDKDPDKHYSPSDLKVGDLATNRKIILSKWWQKGSLFVSSSVIEPNYIKLDELIKTLDATLKDYKVQTELNAVGKHFIHIDLSAATRDQQVFMMGAFKNFFKISHRGDVSNLPTATLNTEGILVLKGISLKVLKQQIIEKGERDFKRTSICAIS
jgi:hypothetical protein